jgi:hypothetical protein
VRERKRERERQRESKSESERDEEYQRGNEGGSGGAVCARVHHGYTVRGGAAVLGGDVARTKEGGREISPMVRRPRGRVRAAVSGMCEGEEIHGAGQILEDVL